jgi:hypothetical protein
MHFSFQEILLTLNRFGLCFFGTPHAGPGNLLRVSFGKACVRIVQSLPRVQSNHNMDALEHGSLFDDLLKESFRHQLEHYRILSFYEGIGDVSN